MKKLGILATIFTLIFALLIPTAKTEAAAAEFKDVPDDFWAAEQIYRFTDLGIIKGYEDGTFRPNNSLTRAQAAIILAGGLKLDTENPAPVQYKDIDEDHYAYKAIAAITNAGIMKGNNGVFQPNKPLTRAQMAIILTNAFELKGNKTASFKDVPKDFYAYEQIDALLAYQVTTGYEDHTFKPFKPTTRAQFVTFLARAMDNDTPMAEMLKVIYANEIAIETYEYKGSMNFGIQLPEELLQDPNSAMLAEMLGNIKVDIAGTYQKDPMLMEATVDLTLSGEVATTFSIPMVITAEKMWLKLPQTPLAPLPEELDGKFIEFDFKEMAELAEQEGQPMYFGGTDLEAQQDFVLALNNLFFDHFANQFYKVVENDAIEVPSGIDVQKVVKFELKNESLKPFIDTFFNGFLPQALELLEDPKYAGALGLTAEDIEMVKQAIAEVNVNVDEIAGEINKVLKINTFDEHIVINKDNFIAYDLLNLDLDFTVEGQTFGFLFDYDFGKSKINEKVEFSIGIPKEADVISFQELMELMEAEMEMEEVPAS